MSKMSELAMELDDQAVELGFESYEEALAKGYEWIIDTRGNAVLYKPSEELDKAHEAWLKERDDILEWLEEAKVHNNENCGSSYINGALERAIEFIKKGEC